MTVDQCIENLKLHHNIIGIVDCDKYSTNSVDLYNQIKNLYLESYGETDRLIFIITKEFYKSSLVCGLMLQSVQAMLNDIDISNFFVCIVTTNPTIKNEYDYVLQNSSTDKVPVNVYVCEGGYHRILDSNQTAYTKYLKIEQNSIVDSLTPKQKHLLFESDNFCMIPWTSVMIDPSSRVTPCCESTLVLGDCSKNSLEQIWNSNVTKQLRKDMLAGKKIKSCERCYIKESLGRDTLRKSVNRRFINKVYKIEATDNHGYCKDFSLNYLDARFNNLCNLSCRSCSHGQSSSWYQPALYIGSIDKSEKAFKIAGKNTHDIFNQVMGHIESLSSIYFAGGEPMMIDQFYKLVEELDARGRHDVELVYNINMTKSSLAGKSIFDVWKNFKKISIGASLDGEHKRGEYLRCGQDWSDVIKFRKELLAKRPDIDFYISATTSILNVLHLPDFHRSWVDQALIAPEDFNLQILFEPKYLRVDHAPDYLKNLIREKYAQHLEWLTPRDPVGRATYCFESILSYLDIETEFDAIDFWNNITQLDNYYGQNLISTFPELKDLPKH